MKKTLIVFAAAAMAFTAVSCSETKEDKPSEKENTTASVAVADEVTTEEETEDELTKILREELEEDMERCADITLQELPEYDIPDDWHEINNGTVRMLIPPDVKETEKMDSSSVSNEYQNEDDSIHIVFYDWNKWDEGWLGTSAFPNLTGDDVKKAFSELGIDYDGTRASLIKAVSSFTSADRAADNEMSYRIASIEKAIEFQYYASVFHNLSDGHDVYIKGNYNRLLSDNEISRVYVLIFSDGNSEYSLLVEGPSEEEVLMMCSTISFS